MNKVESWHYDKASNLGNIVINGVTFPLWRQCVGYKADLETPIMRYQTQVANDWNMSDKFIIESTQIRGLISKIEKHPHRLVR